MIASGMQYGVGQSFGEGQVIECGLGCGMRWVKGLMRSE